MEGAAENSCTGASAAPAGSRAGVVCPRILTGTTRSCWRRSPAALWRSMSPLALPTMSPGSGSGRGRPWNSRPCRLPDSRPGAYGAFLCLAGRHRHLSERFAHRFCGAGAVPSGDPGSSGGGRQGTGAPDPGPASASNGSTTCSAAVKRFSGILTEAVVREGKPAGIIAGME